MIFRGFAPLTSDLTQELILKRIQQQMTLIRRQDVILGTSAVLQRRTALIAAELTAVKVLHHVAENMQEGVLLSNLTQRNAANRILGIHRRRPNGGRVWVRPQLMEAQLMEELRNKTTIEKNKAQGRPALDDAAARTALVAVAGPSDGGAPG